MVVQWHGLCNQLNAKVVRQTREEPEETIVSWYDRTAVVSVWTYAVGILMVVVCMCVLWLQVKLLMVGSASRLRAGVPLLAQLLDWAAEQGSTMKLPADAVTADTGCSAG